MSGPSYNMPQQPTYGEGMADAMKAQMEQLLGQGDFADIYAEAGFEGGNLADIIRDVEAPLRQPHRRIRMFCVRHYWVHARSQLAVLTMIKVDWSLDTRVARKRHN